MGPNFVATCDLHTFTPMKFSRRPKKKGTGTKGREDSGPAATSHLPHRGVEVVSTSN